MKYFLFLFFSFVSFYSFGRDVNYSNLCYSENTEDLIKLRISHNEIGFAGNTDYVEIWKKDVVQSFQSEYYDIDLIEKKDQLRVWVFKDIFMSAFVSQIQTSFFEIILKIKDQSFSLNCHPEENFK